MDIAGRRGTWRAAAIGGKERDLAVGAAVRSVPGASASVPSMNFNELKGNDVIHKLKQ